MDEAPEGRDVNRHDAAIRAVCLTSDKPVPRPAFEMFLDLLRSGHGPKILRLKGIVALSDDPDRPLVIHGVQHVVHAPMTLPSWPDPDHTSRVVVILSELDPAFVHRLWDAFLGRPRLDSPTPRPWRTIPWRSPAAEAGLGGTVLERAIPASAFPASQRPGMGRTG